MQANQIYNTANHNNVIKLQIAKQHKNQLIIIYRAALY